MHHLPTDEIDIDRSDGRSVLGITAAIEDPIDIPLQVNRQRVRSMCQELGVSSMFCRTVKQAQLAPASAHIPRSLVLGTLDRSVAPPM